MDNFPTESKIKECVPGIINEREREEIPKMNKHQSELKDNELYFRVQQR